MNITGFELLIFLAIYSIDLFYTNLTSCNFLVMLYVPFIIIYFAKYLYALIYLNVYIHIREH